MFPKSKPILAIFFIVFVDILAFTLVLPYLPFFAERFGASPGQIGLILTAFAFCQFLAGPILGRMSDQMGRKPILIVSQIGTCIGFLILALAQSLWMVYLARIIDGITAGNITVAQAAMADVTEPHERAKAFSLIGVSFGLGFFIGPAISAGLMHFGPEAPAYGAAFLSFVSIISTALLFKESEQMKLHQQPFRITARDLTECFNFKPIFDFLKRPELKALLLQFMIFNLSFTAHISCFALFAERRLTFHDHPFGAKEVSFLYAYLGLLGIILRSTVTIQLIKKFGERTTARIGFWAQGIGYMSYAFVSTIPGAILAATIGSVGSGLIRPTLTAQMSKAVGPKEQGALFGVGQSLASVASVIAPLIAGFLIGHATVSSWAIFSGASMLIAFLFKQPKENPNLEPLVF